MRLIDAHEYAKQLKNEMDWPGRHPEFISAIECAMADLSDMPTYEIIRAITTFEGERVKSAFWVDDPNCKEPRKHSMYPYCSACLTTAFTKHIYCPHCGAKMDAKKRLMSKTEE